MSLRSMSKERLDAERRAERLRSVRHAISVSGIEAHADLDELVAFYRMDDPDYSPAYQDEYQRLWHVAASERDQAVRERDEQVRSIMGLGSALEKAEQRADRLAAVLEVVTELITEVGKYLASIANDVPHFNSDALSACERGAKVGRDALAADQEQT